MNNPGSRCRGTRCRGGGFTLLEVLITAILLATLLASIWGLYRMFGSLYETGYVQTEEAQLVRCLVQQLAADLTGTVLPPPAAGSRRSGASPALTSAAAGDFRGVVSCAGRVGLFGTYNALRLDVVQADPPYTMQVDLAEPLVGDDEGEMGRSGEIVTVVYSFQPPPLTEMDTLTAAAGLRRQELRISQSSASEWRAVESLAESSPIQYSFAAPRPDSSGWNEDDESRETSRAGKGLSASATTQLPEVVALEFRYFDGQEWTDAWDSRSRRSLPKAVEVAMEVELAGPHKPRATVEKVSPPGAGRAPEPAASGRQPHQPATGETLIAGKKPNYRFVIYLPQAAGQGQGRSRPDSPGATGEEGAPSPVAAASPPPFAEESGLFLGIQR